MYYQSILLASLLIFPWGSVSEVTAQPQSDSFQPNPTWKTAAEKWITDSNLRADIRFLADDLLEGRGPGTRGDELAQRYLISQFQLLGLKPAAGKGSWTQKFSMLGVTTQPPAQLNFEGNSKSLRLKNHDDYIVTTGKPIKQSSIRDAEIVFVGYGMQAPEFEWDDFKNVDVRGKILLVMNNDPADDPKLFAGKRRLYYGRWDYKYAKAAEMGAAGMFIIHTTPSAGYPFQVVQTSWTGEQMALEGQENRD